MVAIAPKVGRPSRQSWRRRLSGAGVVEVKAEAPGSQFINGRSVSQGLVRGVAEIGQTPRRQLGRCPYARATHLRHARAKQSGTQRSAGANLMTRQANAYAARLPLSSSELKTK